MRFGIVGNNDGPLYLLRALQNTAYSPAFVGFQKPIAGELRSTYQEKLKQNVFFEGFDEEELLHKMDSFDIDLLINCFCNFRFSKLLEQSYEVLNVHPSFLPSYRGRHPLQWALINGEKEFGITIHKMIKKYDAGPIYWQKKVPVSLGMSVQELRSLLLQKLQYGFADFLSKYEKGIINPKSHNDTKASYISRRYPEDSKLTEWHDCERIYRKVMALRSEDYPAFIRIDGKKIECIKAKMTDEYCEAPKKPFINALNELWFSVVGKDGRSIWLKSLSGNQQYLSLNQPIS